MSYSLDMDTRANEFQKIINDVQEQLRKYNSISETPTEDTQRVPNELLHEYREKIATAITSTENRTTESYKEFESVMKWINMLRLQKINYTGTENDEKSSLGEFILSFKNNTLQLKSLKDDLSLFLRQQVESGENDTIVRLTELQDRKSVV